MRRVVVESVPVAIEHDADPAEVAAMASEPRVYFIHATGTKQAWTCENAVSPADAFEKWQVAHGVTVRQPLGRGQDHSEQPGPDLRD